MPRTEEANQHIREERRKQLIDVAAPVFARKGLAGTRIADIARVGEMSQGLIFRYFSSKEAIFAAVVEQALQGVSSLEQAMLQQPCSPLGKLHWLLQQYLPSMWLKSDYALVIQHVLNSEAIPPELRETVHKRSYYTLHLYQQLIREGQTIGEIVEGDPAVLALMFGACLEGLSSGVLHLSSILDINGPPDPEVILRILKA